MKRLLPLLAAALLLALAPSCGGGNIGDLFSVFPPDAFEDPGGPGDGGGGGRDFVPGEVRALAGSQGVDGDVKNIAVAQLADDRTIAFLAAGAAGVHVIDVTAPELLSEDDRITTLGPAVLAAPAALAGGRVDALAVIDNRFLVCLAVGSGAANAVTVFDIEILIEDATSTAADVSRAFVPPAAGSAIAAPGNPAGDGGGVAGTGVLFFVAGGGPTLAAADIDPTVPEWSARPALPLTANTANAINVAVNQTVAIYVSVQTTSGGFAVVALGNPDFVPATPVSRPIEGEFDRLLDQVVVGPGNMPLDLAVDGLALYVTGEDSLFVFNITNPVGPELLNELEGTGEDTIGIAAAGQSVGAATGDGIRLFTGFGGQLQPTNAFSFPGTFVVRSLAFLSTERGQFILVCAGDRGGLRVVQLTNIEP